MKQKLLLVIILLFHFHFFAQDYEPILDVNKQWNILSTSMNFEGPDDLFDTYIIRIEDEVIINGIPYFEINGLFMREEVDGNVYMINNNGSESKVYDFNLEIGDTIDLPGFTSESRIWNVINVEFVTIHDIVRKKITLDFSGNEEIWLEGIGSLKGLIYSGTLIIDNSTDLLCYYKDNELLLQYGSSCNQSNEPIFDITFFKENKFTLDHFLIDNDAIELPEGETDALFVAFQGNTNNELEVTFGGMCGNQTSATILLNSNRTQTILNRGGTTLGACNPNLYPNGDSQEFRFFEILTGNYSLQPDNPLLIYYQKSADGTLLTMWNFEDGKLVFNVEEILATDNFVFKDSFEIYPKPVENELTIKTQLSNFNIELFSILGKKIVVVENNENDTVIDVSHLQSGIYFMHLSKNEKSFTTKIIKK